MLAVIIREGELWDQSQRPHYSCPPGLGSHVDSVDSMFDKILGKPVHRPMLHTPPTTVHTMNLFSRRALSNCCPRTSCMSFPQAQTDWNWT